MKRLGKWLQRRQLWVCIICGVFTLSIVISDQWREGQLTQPGAIGAGVASVVVAGATLYICHRLGLLRP
ncbi:MAG: hypothetical protein ACHQ50_07700 [Fimbriimonadales bacterium]